MVLVLKSDHFIIKYSFRDYTPILITKLNFFQNYCTILWIFVLPMKLIQIHLQHIQFKNQKIHLTLTLQNIYGTSNTLSNYRACRSIKTRQVKS